MIKNVVIGVRAYFDSFGLISRLKLWKYFAIPIAISLVTAIVISFLAYGFSDNIGVLISKVWIWNWGKETFTAISTVFGALFIIAIGLIVYKHIVMALSAPFMSPVSEKIEKYLVGDNEQHIRKTSFHQQLVRGIRINVRNLVRELLLTIPILLLGLIPVIGIVSTALLLLVQAYYAGFGNMDYTLERHFNYRESIDFVKKHKGLAIGNGLIFISFLLIPVLGVILVLPFSVVSATKVTVKELHQR